MAIGEEGGNGFTMSTMAVGEEGGSGNMVQLQQNTFTSMAIGEEGGGFRRLEDDRFMTTMAIGEEGGDDFFNPVTVPTMRPTYRITVDPTRRYYPTVDPTQMPAPTKRPTKVDNQYMGYLEYNVE